VIIAIQKPVLKIRRVFTDSSLATRALSVSLRLITQKFFWYTTPSWLMMKVSMFVTP